MIAKVRVGTYKHDDGEQEYTMGCYAVINGILCDNVTKIETSSEHAKLTSATITFTSDVGFTNEPKDTTVITDNPMELAKKLQQYCKGRECIGCVLSNGSCKLSTPYNPTQWELGDDK
jgi:hypothetical protein